MQKRSRRGHGIGARKVSVSVSAEDLRALERRARERHGGNVSAVIHDLVDVLRREQAMDALLDVIDGGRVTDADVDLLRAEIAKAPLARRRGRRAA